MSAILKLTFAALLAGLAWLLARQTIKYSQPYQKIPVYLRDR